MPVLKQVRMEARLPARQHKHNSHWLMKIKPTQNKRGAIIELGPNEAQLPVETLFKLKRILVPVDFSDCSRKALAYAVPFAKQFGAEIVLLHVVQPYLAVAEVAAIDTVAIRNQARETAKGELKKLRLSIAEDVQIRTLVRMGNPAHEIVKSAATVDADLILLSTHGRTGLGRVLFGSVAEHVTRYAKCPVLTVREREHEFVDAVNLRATKPSKKTRNALNRVSAL
jgi:universal stress protein A